MHPFWPGCWEARSSSSITARINLQSFCKGFAASSPPLVLAVMELETDSSLTATAHLLWGWVVLITSSLAPLDHSTLCSAARENMNILSGFYLSSCQQGAPVIGSEIPACLSGSISHGCRIPLHPAGLANTISPHRRLRCCSLPWCLPHQRDSPNKAQVTRKHVEGAGHDSCH